MKSELAIIVVSLCLVVAGGFFIYNSPIVGITGHSIQGEIENEITQDQALLAIEESSAIILEMEEAGFATIYLQDTFLEAERVLEQVNYAEILRENVEASKFEIQEARKALQVIDWEGLNYGDVLQHTNEIKKRKEEAFLLTDKMVVAEASLQNEVKDGVLTSPGEEEQIFIEAKRAFEEERYGDAEVLLSNLETQIEERKEEFSTLKSVQRGVKNFFQIYWIYILAFLLVSGTSGFFSFKKVKRVLLKKKIRRMNAEKIALKDLIKKAQKARFKENKISGFTYNIRIKKYKEKLGEIKQELPVFESELKKPGKNKAEKKTLTKTIKNKKSLTK